MFVSIERYPRYQLRLGQNGPVVAGQLRKGNVLDGSIFLLHTNSSVFRLTFHSLQLKSFKLKHGHCNAVPSLLGGDRSLYLWVSKQRRKYNNYKNGKKKDSLTEKQVALLDEMDFASSSNLDASAAASQVVDAVIMNRAEDDSGDCAMMNAVDSLLEGEMQYT